MQTENLPKGKLIGAAVFLGVAILIAIYMLVPSSGSTKEVKQAEEAQKKLTEESSQAGINKTEEVPPPAAPPSKRSRKVE